MYIPDIVNYLGKSWGQAKQQAYANSNKKIDLIDLRAKQTITYKYWDSMKALMQGQAPNGYVTINKGRYLPLCERLDWGWLKNGTYVNDNPHTKSFRFIAFFDEADGKRKVIGFGENIQFFDVLKSQYTVRFEDFSSDKLVEFLALQRSLYHLTNSLAIGKKLYMAVSSVPVYKRTKKQNDFIQRYDSLVSFVKQAYPKELFSVGTIEVKTKDISIGVIPAVVWVVIVLCGSGLIAFGIQQYRQYKEATEKFKSTCDMINNSIKSDDETLRLLADGKITQEQANQRYAQTQQVRADAKETQTELIQEESNKDKAKQDKWLKIQNMAYAGAGIVALLVLPNLLSTFKKRA